MAFEQSANPFGGFNNTDLRASRGRRRRRKGVLDLSLQNDGRNGGMNKSFEALVDTLRGSVMEIALSDSDKREELLNTSFDQFQEATGEELAKMDDAIVGPLEKGINHIAAFANALNRMSGTVDAIRTGRGYVLSSDGPSSDRPDPIPEHLLPTLDAFMRHGILTLRTMVNDSSELADEDDMTALERGETIEGLMKIEGTSGHTFAISALPEPLRVYLTDPVDLFLEKVEVSRGLMADGRIMGEALLEAELIPEEMLATLDDVFPDLFEAPEAITKAEFDMLERGGLLHKAGDEAVGDGSADQGAGAEPTDPGDDGQPNDPVEMIARLSSIITVIAGSMLQMRDGGQTPDPNAVADPSATPGAPGGGPNVGLTRSTPPPDAPLSKIFSGEVPVSDELADALEELVRLREEVPTLNKRLGDQSADLTKLRQTVEQMRRAPAQPVGATRVVSVSKGVDQSGQPGAMEKIERLKETDPDAAAKELIKMAQAGGGQPVEFLERS